MNAYKLLKKVHETHAEEILCSECLDQVSRYVDLELDDQQVETLMPHLKHHLNQCPVCFEEYTILSDLARLERAGKPVLLDDLFSDLSE